MKKLLLYIVLEEVFPPLPPKHEPLFIEHPKKIRMSNCGSKNGYKILLLPKVNNKIM